MACPDARRHIPAQGEFACSLALSLSLSLSEHPSSPALGYWHLWFLDFRLGPALTSLPPLVLSSSGLHRNYTASSAGPPACRQPMRGLLSIHNHVSQSLITRLFLNINVSIYVLLVLLLWIILTHALALQVVLPWTRASPQEADCRRLNVACRKCSWNQSPWKRRVGRRSE